MCKKIHRGGNAEQYNADKKYKEAVAVAVEKCADDTKGQTSSSESRLGVRGVRTRRLCFFVVASMASRRTISRRWRDDDTVKARETPLGAA